MALYRRMILSLAAAFMAMPAPASAQRLAVEAGKWNIDYGEIRCSLSRRMGGPQSPVIILSSFMGVPEPEFLLMRDGSETLPDLPRRIDVVLLPSNHVSRAVLHRRATQGGAVLSLRELDEGFIARFAGASSVRFQAGGRRIAEVAIPQAAEAVAALRACNDDLLRSWGVDPADRPVSMPRLISGSITNADYPSELAMRGVGGATVMRLAIDAEGRASSCHIQVSSGNADLDNQACGAARLRFRFEPGRNAEGQAVPSLYVQTVRWISGE